ncbi:hypothetical protein K474DRAFT_854098 [Panus rudis PR-1116 ss-1]|nr:hypothetical protein K474DRAFT_854098 [Panus rudis PR-1116 ss-1]
MQKDTRRLHALRMREAFGPGDWDDTSTPALGSEPFDHRKYLTKTTPTKPSFNPAAQRKKPDVFELVFTDGLLECVLELARTQDVEKPFTIEMLRKSSGPHFRFWDQSCVIKDGYARYALIFLEPEDAEPEFRKKLYEDVYRSGVKVEPDDPGTLFWAVMFSVRIESPVHIKELKFRAGLVLLEVNAVKKAVVGKAQENTKIEHGLHSATKVMKNFTPHREQPRPGSEASHTLSQIIPPKVASITDLGSSAVVTVPALSSIASGVESKVPFISNEVASVDTVLVNDEKAARRSLDPIMPTELVPTATPAAKDQGLSLGDNSRKPSDAAHSIPPSASMLQASLLALNTFAKKSNPGEVIGLAISSSSSGMLADMLTNIGTRAIATSSSAKRVVSDGSSTTQEQNEPASLNFSNAANHATTASGARSSRYYFSAPSATTPTLVPGNRYSMAWSKPGSFVVGAARLTPQGMATRDSMPSLEDVERDLEAGTRLVSEFEVEEGLMLRDKRTELVKRLTKFIQAVATVFLSPWRGMLRLIRRG